MHGDEHLSLLHLHQFLGVAPVADAIGSEELDEVVIVRGKASQGEDLARGQGGLGGGQRFAVDREVDDDQVLHVLAIRRGSRSKCLSGRTMLLP